MGYGGTKAEMERLLADAQAITGVEYNIENLNDVYSAIHVIQTEMGITGTTAKEASSTFTGSFAAMKAAAENILAHWSLGDGLEKPLKSAAKAVQTFLVDNLIPMVQNIIKQIPDMINILGDIITPMMPAMIEGAVELITWLATGLIQNIPTIIDTFLEIIGSIAIALTQVDWLSIGSQLMESLTGAIETASWPALGTIGLIAMKLVSGFKLTGMITNVMTAVKGVTAALGFLTSPVSWVVLLIIAAAAVIIKNWDAIKEGAEAFVVGVKLAWEDMQSKIDAVTTFVSTEIPAMWESFKQAVSEKVTSLVSSVQQAWEDLKTTVVTKATEIKDDAIEKWETLKTDVTSKVEELKTTIPQAWEDMKTAIHDKIAAILLDVLNKWESIKANTINTFNSIKQTAIDKWEELKTNVIEKIEGLKASATEAFENMKSTISQKLTTMKADVIAKWESIKSQVTTKIETMKQNVVDKWESIRSNVSQKISSVKLTVLNGWETIKSRTSTAWEAVKNFIKEPFENARQKVSSVISSIRITVSTGFNSVKTTVKNAWEKIKGFITDPIDSAWQTLTGIVEDIKGVLDFSSFKITWPHIDLPHIVQTGTGVLGIPTYGIQWYDKGGIFNQPSVIGVGEKRPEFVGALDDLRRIVRDETGGGRSVVINVYPREGQDEESIAAAVERRLNAQLATKAGVWA